MQNRTNLIALLLTLGLLTAGCTAIPLGNANITGNATTNQNSATTTNQAIEATGTIDINDLKLGTVVPLDYCQGRCVANQTCVVDVECPPCAVGEDGKYLGNCTCARGYTCQQN